jgi:DNA repair ATPase RecN
MIDLLTSEGATAALIGALAGALISGIVGLVAYLYRDRLMLTRDRLDRTMDDLGSIAMSSKSRDDALRQQLHEIDDSVSEVSSELEEVISVVTSNAEKHELAREERQSIENRFDNKIDTLRDQSVRVRELASLRKHMNDQFHLMREWMRNQFDIPEADDE